MVNGKASPMLFAFIYWDVESEVPGYGELELLVRRLLPGAQWSAWSGPVKAAKKRETLTSKVAEQVRAELGKLLDEGVERISTRELRRRMKLSRARVSAEVFSNAITGALGVDWGWVRVRQTLVRVHRWDAMTFGAEQC